MKGIDLLETKLWKPLSWLGFRHSFFSLNAETITYTWLILAILLIILLIVRSRLKRKNSMGAFVVTTFVASFMELCEQTLGTAFTFKHFSFVTAIFIFIFLCNAISILPWTEEPTKDINTTLALGFITFIYIQAYAIKAHGIKEYLKEYFAPFFLMFPLNIIGKLATIISISFRLFGNIFGGSIIGNIYLSAIQGSVLWESFGLLTGTNLTILLFFGLFEGFLQAFVFAMLTLTYLSIALQNDESNE